MGYKHKDTRLDQIGRDLSVQYVLENSLRESGNHIRLTSQLIQVEGSDSPVVKGLRLSGKRHSYHRRRCSQGRCAGDPAAFDSQQQAELAQLHRVNPDAFDAYCRGTTTLSGTPTRYGDGWKYYDERRSCPPMRWLGVGCRTSQAIVQSFSAKPASTAHAQPVALLIGISTYTHGLPLRTRDNPTKPTHRRDQAASLVRSTSQPSPYLCGVPLK